MLILQISNKLQKILSTFATALASLAVISVGMLMFYNYFKKGSTIPYSLQNNTKSEQARTHNKGNASKKELGKLEQNTLTLASPIVQSPPVSPYVEKTNDAQSSFDMEDYQKNGPTSNYIEAYLPNSEKTTYPSKQNDIDFDLNTNTINNVKPIRNDELLPTFAEIDKSNTNMSKLRGFVDKAKSVVANRFNLFKKSTNNACKPLLDEINTPESSENETNDYSKSALITINESSSTALPSLLPDINLNYNQENLGMNGNYQNELLPYQTQDSSPLSIDNLDTTVVLINTEDKTNKPSQDTLKSNGEDSSYDIKSPLNIESIHNQSDYNINEPCMDIDFNNFFSTQQKSQQLNQQVIGTIEFNANSQHDNNDIISEDSEETIVGKNYNLTVSSKPEQTPKKQGFLSKLSFISLFKSKQP